VAQLLDGQVAVLLVDVDEHITDPTVGLKALSADVDAVLREDGVDLGQHAGHVVVNVQEPVHAGRSGQRHQGSISAEHGIGLMKKPYLGYTRSPEEIAYLKAIKNAFDPHNVMNPGKLLDL
jgi:FAD/FMN-containing dehydrogenase